MTDRSYRVMNSSTTIGSFWALSFCSGDCLVYMTLALSSCSRGCLVYDTYRAPGMSTTNNANARTFLSAGQQSISKVIRDLDAEFSPPRQAKALYSYRHIFLCAWVIIVSCTLLLKVKDTAPSQEHPSFFGLLGKAPGLEQHIQAVGALLLAVCPRPSCCECPLPFP